MANWSPACPRLKSMIPSESPVTEVLISRFENTCQDKIKIRESASVDAIECACWFTSFTRMLEEIDRHLEHSTTTNRAQHLYFQQRQIWLDQVAHCGHCSAEQGWNTDSVTISFVYKHSRF